MLRNGYCTNSAVGISKVKILHSFFLIWWAKRWQESYPVTDRSCLSIHPISCTVTIQPEEMFIFKSVHIQVLFPLKITIGKSMSSFAVTVSTTEMSFFTTCSNEYAFGNTFFTVCVCWKSKYTPVLSTLIVKLSSNSSSLCIIFQILRQGHVMRCFCAKWKILISHEGNCPSPTCHKPGWHQSD